MKRAFLMAAVLVGMNLGVNFAVAHHGNATHFDSSKPVTVTGAITRHAFTNLYTFIHFERTVHLNISEHRSSIKLITFTKE